MTVLTDTPLHRTMRRAIAHVVGDTAAADLVLDAILERHPHLAQVWSENTCRGCAAILTPLDKAEARECCDFCQWQAGHDYYADNLKMYGGE